MRSRTSPTPRRRRRRRPSTFEIRDLDTQRGVVYSSETSLDRDWDISRPSWRGSDNSGRQVEFIS